MANMAMVMGMGITMAVAVAVAKAMVVVAITEGNAALTGPAVLINRVGRQRSIRCHGHGYGSYGGGGSNNRGEEEEGCCHHAGVWTRECLLFVLREEVGEFAALCEGNARQQVGIVPLCVEARQKVG